MAVWLVPSRSGVGATTLGVEVVAMAAVTVVVVDDQITFLHAMATVVEETPGFCVVGMASTGEESLLVTDDLRPHLVIM